MLFAAFQRSNTTRHGAPVIAIADAILLENTSASALVRSDDRAALHARIAGTAGRAGTIASMTLCTGRSVRVHWERPVPRVGVVVEIDPLDAVVVEIDPLEALSSTDAALLGSQTVAIIGEPGSGRTTALRGWAGKRPVDRFDAADLALGDTTHWLTTVMSRLGDVEATVVVENVHLLAELVACALNEAIGSAAARVGVSSNPIDDHAFERRHLVTGCRERFELTPLRLRRHEIPSIARTMLARRGSDRYFTPAAITALVNHRWPGNLAELADEIDYLVERRSAGAITDRDLRQPLLITQSGRARNPIDTAMHEAIVNGLLFHGGNKSATADHLGMSRTTLYKRMRDLHIPG